MDKTTLADWQDKAATLAIEGRAFIDGAYRDAHGGKTFDCVSPIDGRVLAKVADCGAADVDRRWPPRGARSTRRRGRA